MLIWRLCENLSLRYEKNINFEIVQSVDIVFIVLTFILLTFFGVKAVSCAVLLSHSQTSKKYTIRISFFASQTIFGKIHESIQWTFPQNSHLIMNIESDRFIMNSVNNQSSIKIIVTNKMSGEYRYYDTESSNPYNANCSSMFLSSSDLHESAN